MKSEFSCACLVLEAQNWKALAGNSVGKVLMVWKEGILIEGLIDPARPVIFKKGPESQITIEFKTPIAKRMIMSKGLTLIKSKVNCIEMFTPHLNDLELKEALFSSFLSFYHPFIFNTFEKWKESVSSRYNNRHVIGDICSFFGLREGKIYSFTNENEPQSHDEIFAYQALLTKSGHYWQKNQVAISCGNDQDVAVFIDHDQKLEIKMIKTIEFLLKMVSLSNHETPLKLDNTWAMNFLMKANKVVMLEGEERDIFEFRNYCRKKVAGDSFLELDLGKVKSLKDATFSYEEVMRYKVFWIDNISKMTARDADELCRVFRKFNGKIILSDQRPLHLLNLSLFPAELRWYLEEVPQIHARTYLQSELKGACAV